MLKELHGLGNRFLRLDPNDQPNLVLRHLLRFAQDIFLTIALFWHKNCFLQATAMTLYTLLAIVPVVALAYGIAQGFGLEKILQRWLETQFTGQEEILSWLMEFARKILGRAKGSVIAGVGILFLFWSVYRILWQIEQALNAIWEIQTPRNFQQRLNDYLFMLVVCPLLVMLSSSLMIFIVSNISSLIAGDSTLKIFLPLLRMLPGCVIWVLFYFMYVFMPNTRVEQRPALLGGLLFGSIYTLWQWIYLNSQIALSAYNAVYGSFAALPIFILWLNISWIIVLMGAQLVFVRQNNTSGSAIDLWPGEKTSHSQDIICTLHVAAFCANRFYHNQPAPTQTQIAHSLGLHPHKVLSLLNQLQAAKILTACSGSQTTWQPAVPLSQLTPALVVTRLEGEEHTLSLPPLLAPSCLKTTYMALRLNGQEAHRPLHEFAAE